MQFIELEAGRRARMQMRAPRQRRAFALALGALVTASAHASLEAPWTKSWPAMDEVKPLPLSPAAPAAKTAAVTSAPTTPALLFPVPAGRRTGLETHFLSRRGRSLHHAVDIGAARQTPIHAATAGTIVRLHRSRKGGIAIEQVAASGEYCLYYAHLQRYASGLKVGQQVSRDQILGFVGSTGHARGPHLHFQVMKLEPGQDCWAGTPLDPLPLFERPPAAFALPDAGQRPMEGQ